MHDRKHGTSNKWRATALLALACAGAALHAHADDLGDSPAGNARFTGPLVSGPPALPQGLLVVEPYLLFHRDHGRYDRDGERIAGDGPDLWQLSVPIIYGLTDRLTLQATLNAFRGDNGLADTVTRAGDASVQMLYGLWKGEGRLPSTLTFVFSQNLPIGTHDKLALHPDNIATGSGAATTRVGFNTQSYAHVGGRLLRTRTNLRWRAPHDGIPVHGQSTYGTQRGFEGEAELRTAWDATVGAEYVLNRTWVLAMDAIYERSSGFHVRGLAPDASGALKATRIDQDGGWRLSFAPAVQAHVSDTVGVIAGVFVSTHGRNTSAALSPQVAVNLVF